MITDAAQRLVDEAKAELLAMDSLTTRCNLCGNEMGILAATNELRICDDCYGSATAGICPVCQGRGRVELRMGLAIIRCTNCRGTGEILSPPMPLDEIVDQPQPKYACQYCSRVCQTKSALTNHEKACKARME